jgi:hypothetical protein
VAKNLLWVALAIIALIVVGWVVINVLGALLKLALYLIIGAAVVYGVVWLINRGKRAARTGD